MKHLVPFQRTILLSGFVIVLGLFVAQSALEAQPTMNLKRVNNLWPNIELFFEVGCNGQPSYTFDQAQHLTLKENGVEITNFTLYKYDPTIKCNVSIGLVLDASSAMSASNTADAKFAANYLVDQFDPRYDEGSVVWYNSTAQLKQAVTKDTALLHSAINTLPASGSAAPWDGIYAGLMDIINSGTNPSRAIIVIASGADGVASTHTQQDVIQLAIYNRIRVFTITLAANPNPGFENIALLTGGNFYSSPTPAQLSAIMQSINTMILAGFSENIILYRSHCMDGSVREVELTLHDYCGGADSKVKYFRAPKDTSTFMPLDIALGKRKGRGNSEVRVPIDLLTGIPPQSGLAKSAFEIQFDPACVQFKAIETPPGTLFAGIPITVEYTANGVLLKTTQSAAVEGMGTLAEVIFQLSDPDDTTCCELKMASWIFESGCFRPVLRDGEICIDPRSPIIICGIEAADKLEWQRSVKDYIPNPFQVRCRVFNQGDKDATNVMIKIDYNPVDLQLISPYSDLQPGAPVNVPSANVSEAAWLVKAKPRLMGDSIDVAITAMFDNHKNVTCHKKIWIPPTGPILQCTAAAQKVEADNQGQRYVPMPFQISVTAQNAGGMSTDTVFASIELPPDLTLMNPSLQTQRISPAVLAPNQKGTSVWMLKHPITVTEKEYVVRIWVKTSNTDSSLCECKVTIPPLQAPILQTSYIAPMQLTFDENLGEYTPNPFEVKLQVINVSPTPATNTTTSLWLPGNIVLEPATQDLHHSFGTLTQYHAGDPIPTATWTVRYTKKPRINTTLEFKWSTTCTGPTGVTTDTVLAICQIELPAIPLGYSYRIEIPDSIGLNPSGTSNQPNPFPVRYIIKNISHQVGVIEKVEVKFSTADGVELDPASPNPKTVLLHDTLLPGEELQTTWLIQIKNRINARNLVMNCFAVDSDANTYADQDTLYIAPVSTAIACSMSSTESRIVFDQAQQKYLNPEWTITADIVNNGGVALTQINASIHIADPAMVEFDPAYAGIDANPYSFPVLFDNSVLQPVWHFRLKQPNTSTAPIDVAFSLDIGTFEIPLVSDACNFILSIDPVLPPLPPVKRREVPELDSTYSGGVFDRPTHGTAPKLTDPQTDAAPLTFSLGQNKPNPFNPSTMIEYSLAEDTRAVLSVYNLLGKQVKVLVNEEQKSGNYRLVFNAAGLPSGMYLYKLETPKYSSIKRMVLAK